MMLAGISILVLDDDADALDLFVGTLRKLGAEVRSAATGEAALAIAQSWRPDAVLCDLHLPEMDGYAFLARLRAIGGRRVVPVIAVSASHPEIEREKALAAGFAEYVVKPARIGSVVAAVTRAIAGATEQDSAVAAGASN
jgi:two-component system, OmpR family, response regulator